MIPPYSFRRLVLAVGHDEAGPATLRHAAELARLLRIDLHCVLIENEALFGAPALPFTRELRLLTHEWRPLDPDRLAEDFTAMAAILRRNLAMLGSSLGIAQELEVQRGDPERCLGALCAVGDVVVLTGDVGSRPHPHPSAVLYDVALRSAASVLLLPPGPVPANAMVAVLLADPDDASLEIAAGIAKDAGTTLLAVLAAGESATVAQRAVALGVPPSQLEIRPATERSLAAIGAALGATRVRLMVLNRAAWSDEAISDAATGPPATGPLYLPAALARQLGTPVLIVETPSTAARG